MVLTLGCAGHQAHVSSAGSPTGSSTLQRFQVSGETMHCTKAAMCWLLQGQRGNREHLLLSANGLGKVCGSEHGSSWGPFAETLPVLLQEAAAEGDLPHPFKEQIITKYCLCLPVFWGVGERHQKWISVLRMPVISEIQYYLTTCLWLQHFLF